MTQLTCWEADSSVVSFSDIMSWCLRHHAVDRMLLTLHLKPVGKKTWRFSNQAAADNLKSLFGKYILTGFHASEWPGTKSMEGAVFVCVLTFNEDVRNIILSTQPSLDKWQDREEPPLPEDICLFKQSDSNPILVSCTHEPYIWLITDKRPDVQGFNKSKCSPEDLFYKGEYFCRKYDRKRLHRRR